MPLFANVYAFTMAVMVVLPIGFAGVHLACSSGSIRVSDGKLIALFWVVGIAFIISLSLLVWGWYWLQRPFLPC